MGTLICVTIKIQKTNLILNNKIYKTDNFFRIYLGCWVDGELEFAFLAVVNREAFHEEGCESRPSAAAERVENEESLQTGAHVSQLADAVEDDVHDLLADGVVSARVVVGRVLFSGD